MGLFDAIFGGTAQVAQPQLQQYVTPQQTAQGINTAQGAIGQQQSMYDALQAGANPFASQGNLLGQLEQASLGQGPNPALAQLANTTGQNVNQQAALMAGQRGVGANPGLMGRQIAMQGAGIQQNAAGQAAAMAAQQQIQARQQLMQQQSQMAGQNLGALQNLNQFALQNQGNLLNAGANQNQAEIGRANAINQANQGMRQTQGGLFGGLFNAAAGALAGPIGGMFGAASGGSGGGGLSSLDQYDINSGNVGGGRVGGGVQALATGGEVTNGPKSKVGQHLCMQTGGKVPGKAKKAGDSASNDTVDAKLSPGEVVIPRSIMQGDNAPEAAAKFVAAIMRKHGR